MIASAIAFAIALMARPTVQKIRKWRARRDGERSSAQGSLELIESDLADELHR
jgi:hypothetical protein